jgi:tripartite ATP-independent transporter DctM subunit
VPKEERATWGEKLVSLRGVVLPVLLVVFVLGAIYTGVCTPTEAGGVGAGGALLCAAIYRNLSWEKFKQAAITTLKVNAMLMWLVIGGTMFASVSSLGGAANVAKAAVLALPLTPFGTLVLMMVVILIMGMFMENVAIAMITLPIFMPIATELGFDPLWFGIIYSIGVLIGIITPPFGYSLFYFKGLNHADVTLRDVYIASLPFAGIMIFVLGLCLVFPQIALWVPNAMIK